MSMKKTIKGTLKANWLKIGKNTTDNDYRYIQQFCSLFRAEPVSEGRLKVILLLQVSSHDFEPTFNTVALIFRILPDPTKIKINHQTFDM